MNNDQSESIMSTLGASTFQQQRKKRLSLRMHRIDVEKEYIRVVLFGLSQNKNYIVYSSLTQPIKYFFIEVYKKCILAGCLEKIFKGWGADQLEVGASKSTLLKDVDAFPLIWKMLKTLRSNGSSKSANTLVPLLQQKYEKLKQYKDFQQQTKDKIIQIEKIMKLGNNRISNEQEKIYAALKVQFQGLMKKIENIQNIIRKIDKRMEHQKAQVRQNSSIVKQITMMEKLMSKTISKIARNLIKQTIVLIVQVEPDIIDEEQLDKKQAYVIFEQSYHTIKVQRSDLIKLIGGQAYVQKTRKIHSIHAKMNEHQIFRKIVCCHRCMEATCQQNFNTCRKKITKRETRSYTGTDPQTYKKQIIESDFFSQSNEQNVLPYFRYSKNEKGDLCCNRSFCNDCLRTFYKKNPNAFQCPYCIGLCNCRRCQMAASLVKLMSYDLGEQPSEKAKNYHNILNILSQNPSKYVLESFPLRNYYRFDEYHIISSNVPQSTKIKFTIDLVSFKGEQRLENNMYTENTGDQIDEKNDEDEEEANFHFKYISNEQPILSLIQFDQISDDSK